MPQALPNAYDLPDDGLIVAYSKPRDVRLSQEPLRPRRISERLLPNVLQTPSVSPTQTAGHTVGSRTRPIPRGRRLAVYGLARI